MNISTLMNKEVFAIKSNETLHEAARLMWEHDCGALPVIDEHESVVGMITDRDIAMAALLKGQPLTQLSIYDTMSKTVYRVVEDQPLESAESIMRLNQIRRLPVINKQQQLVGIISLNDIAMEFSTSRGKSVKANEVAETLAGVCKHRSIEEGETA